MKTSMPGDQASKNTSVAVSSKICILNNFEEASWDSWASQTVQPGLQVSVALSRHTETEQKQQARSSGLDRYPSFLRSTEDARAPDNSK